MLQVSLSCLPIFQRVHSFILQHHVRTSPLSPSGHYWIQSSSTGYATMEYCLMSPPCSCNSSPGWMRVANLDMTNSSQRCPSGLIAETSGTKKFSCRDGSGCPSVIFPVNGVRYSKVCGKVIGYQYYSMDTFHSYFLIRVWI